MTAFHFFVFHCLAFIALLVNIGAENDGFNDQTRQLNLRGKIATFVILPLSLFSFVFFLLGNALHLPMSSVYLSYLITIAAYLMPFLTNCHNPNSRFLIKINLVGYLTLIIGLSGLIGTGLWAFDSKNSTENVNDYMELLGQFIASTSALIALSGATVYTDSQGRSRLSDLGNVAAVVIFIGFGVSAINAITANRKQENLANTAEDTRKTLLSADSVITKQLKPNLVLVNKQIGDVLPTLQKIMGQLRDLQTINDKITNLQKDVAKNTELTKLEKIVAEHNKAVDNLKVTVEKVDQETQKINTLQQTLQTYQTQLAVLERNVNRVEGLENKIVDLAGKVEKLRSETEKMGNMQDKLDKVQETISSLQSNLTTIQNNVRDLQSLKNQDAKLEDLKQRIGNIDQLLKKMQESKRDSL